MRLGFIMIVLGGLPMAACTPEVSEDTGIELPPEDTDADTDTGPGDFPVDTGLGLDLNEEPQDYLTMRHWGEWNLTPNLGPYNSLNGELRVQEYLNNERPDTGEPPPNTEPLVLECDLVYAIQGVPHEQVCPGCDFAFRVTYALISGDLTMCHDPDLPKHGAEASLGFDQAGGVVMLDYKSVGLWTPWYSAAKIGDQVTFEWEVRVGYVIEEEDD